MSQLCSLLSDRIDKVLGSMCISSMLKLDFKRFLRIVCPMIAEIINSSFLGVESLKEMVSGVLA